MRDSSNKRMDARRLSNKQPSEPLPYSERGRCFAQASATGFLSVANSRLQTAGSASD